SVRHGTAQRCPAYTGRTINTWHAGDGRSGLTRTTRCCRTEDRCGARHTARRGAARRTTAETARAAERQAAAARQEEALERTNAPPDQARSRHSQQSLTCANTV